MLRGLIQVTDGPYTFCDDGSRVDTDGGVYRMRDDEPAPRIGAAPYRTP